MVELIPALLVESRDEFERRVRLIEACAPLAHIDVIDGSWLAGNSWADPDAIAHIESPLHYELHLMVAHPIEHLTAWEELPAVRRVIFHIETTTQPKQVIEAIRFYGWEAAIALNPETPLSAVRDLAPYVDEIMFMTVKPGASGRPFEQRVLTKISELREHGVETIIGVDGAISTETLALCADACASRARVNSALFSSASQPDVAWRALETVARSV